LICPVCNSRVFTIWSKYTRSSLPGEKPLTIQRVRCSGCKVTHALLPTFLFGKIRYTDKTITPYVEQFIKDKITIAQLFKKSHSPVAPQEISTLYRWFKRIFHRCKTLLPLLKKELIELNPQTDLKQLETIMLDKDMTSPHYICNTAWLLAEMLLLVCSEQLQSQKCSLTTITFLNYFSWQNTGDMLLAVLPPEPG
jgi:hypothetical protein